jgi:hypothetical protein
MTHKCAVHLFKISLSLVGLLLLSACQSTPMVKNYTDEHPKSGFLSDYTKLKLIEGEDEEQVLRWVSPKLVQGKFKNLILDPVVLQPSSLQNEEISQESLQEIQSYFNLKLKQVLSPKYELTNTPSNETAHIKIAISDIQLESEGMKVTEVLPYGAVIGLIRAATDTRNREVTVILEMEILNSKTHEPVVSLLRVGEGENVRMLWDADFTLLHVKELLDSWVALASNNFQKLLD